MRTERLSLNHLENILPDFPITLACDDGHFTNIFSTVTFTGPAEVAPGNYRKIPIIDACGNKNCLFEWDLKHFPAPKQTPISAAVVVDQQRGQND
jgi:hypothetical protein